jgi:hypothetical protein
VLLQRAGALYWQSGNDCYQLVRHDMMAVSSAWLASEGWHAEVPAGILRLSMLDAAI